MWVFTTGGFVSAVQAHNGKDLVVRARDKVSLKELAALAEVSIERTPQRDYPYRVHVTAETFRGWLVTQVDELDYRNFKDAVHTERGHEFAYALLKVWSAMHDVEDDSARGSL